MGLILNYYILYTNGGEHPKLFSVSLHSTLCNIEYVKRLMAHFCPLIISVTSGQNEPSASNLAFCCRNAAFLCMAFKIALYLGIFDSKTFNLQQSTWLMF
mgnify:CR=1 FL=1